MRYRKRRVYRQHLDASRSPLVLHLGLLDDLSVEETGFDQRCSWIQEWLVDIKHFLEFYLLALLFAQSFDRCLA